MRGYNERDSSEFSLASLASRSRGSAMLTRASKYAFLSTSLVRLLFEGVSFSSSSLQLRLLFEGGYYSGCGYYSSI